VTNVTDKLKREEQMVKTIMIVDDLPELTYTVKCGLENLDPDYNVIRVESGEKCLELLEKNEIPDLILLDIMMPDMNGWEVHRRIQERPQWRNIPIVFLTAVEDETSKITGSVIGEGYIEKPFEILDLKEKIDEVLKKKKP
jgi:CheY-like chemotaxis protein